MPDPKGSSNSLLTPRSGKGRWNIFNPSASGNNINPGLEINKKPLWVDLIAVLLPVLFFSLAIKVYSNELLLINVMLYIVLAQGINVSYGFTGYLPFGYVGFFGTGAYAASLSILFLHFPAVLAVVVGGVVAALFGLLLSPLLRLSGSYFAIATLAAAEAIFAIIGNPSLASVTKGPYGIDIGSVYNSGASYTSAVVLVGLVMLIVVLLNRSNLGLALRSIRNDPVSAAMAGVNVVRERMIAWIIAAVFAGLAGGIFAWAISVFYPSAVFDLSTSVFAIVFALFGGVGSVYGPLVGAVILYGLYSFIGISQPQYFQVIYGLLIVALVLFVPGGLAGMVKALTKKRSQHPPKGVIDG